MIRLQHLALPPPSNFAGDENELVPLFPGPSGLNSGGKDCRTEGLPRLVEKVGPLKEL